jgi:hypothetical protein
MKQSDVLKAIKGSGAVMSTIAKRLDCAWYTARKYVNKWDATKQAYEDEEQMILDLAESKIYESINNGNTQDAKWLLATKGKKRGFTERQEITGADGGAVDIAVRIHFVNNDG